MKGDLGRYRNQKAYRDNWGRVFTGKLTLIVERGVVIDENGEESINIYDVIYGPGEWIDDEVSDVQRK